MDITLKQVAKVAGVSHTTVSLVINNAEGSRVSPQTRERVLAAIRDLDYNPNLTAKRLASGKTNCIGLYTPFEMPIFRNYAFNEMVTGVQDVLFRKGMDIVWFSGGRILYKNRPINQIVRENTVDGLLIFNSRHTGLRYVNNYIKNLNALKFRYVVLHYYWGKSKINYIGIDYEKDARRAVMHLTTLGHRQIALIAGPAKATVTARIIDGYKGALKASQIAFNENYIAFADYDYQKAYEKTRELIQRNPDITAFFIGGFEMAPACLRAVKDLGFRVPQDISIISYIDNDIMPLMEPPITAIRWPYRDMGIKAAEMLFEDQADRKKILFETELIIRGSTAEKR